MQTKKRPVYLDMPTIIKHLPIPAIVSILHRASGVAIFLCLPILLALLAGSLSSGEVFLQYKSWAGIRFLLIDAHIGVELQAARKSARIVLFGAAATAFVLGIFLW